MVGSTKGFLVRDYSLGLGWNNVRYIIESSILQAHLLNRTLVLPSFVYARSCEYDIEVCADYAPMFNKGDAIGLDEWRDLPIDQQMTWRIPITTMINLTHLRLTHSVILLSDYLRLHNISADQEWSNGQWLRETYHTQPNIFNGRKPTFNVVENQWFDPADVLRVDILPEDMKKRGAWTEEGGDWLRAQTGSWQNNATTITNDALYAAVPSDRDRKILSWEEASTALEFDIPDSVEENFDVDVTSLKLGQRWDLSSAEQIERVLQANGWEVLYTYTGAVGMDYVKHVATPVKQVAPRNMIRGFVDEYDHSDADVLLLAGELHLGRKPASLRFTTPEGRDKFSRLVLHELRPIDKVFELAELLDERMLALNSGRMWVAAHMRRGDFVKAGWVMEKSIEDHTRRVKEKLSDGRSVLASLREPDMKSYDVPNVTVDRSSLYRHPPLEDDKFYIATDERDLGNITYLADNNAVLVYDLLTIEDRHNFGWGLLFTDVLALVEQATLARAAFFYAHAMSSVAGGVINLRAARGADPRTALID
ncbi:hypothetical protein FIBSPDRAFT_724960 [Athelia psychrophila]|uniref:Uncharacterized protein n=1 Tax=Athelia psychrophila TaxID=1759441 RepID=A0A166U6Q4_9AGAM|nr:hypothetical protein FIBSPDRAFT_724960 [Fibularhizoctonia sp. CBS 109695]